MQSVLVFVKHKRLRVAPGRPYANVTPNSANKLITQFKAPHTSSECKILVVISKSLTFPGGSKF